jgi:hypothetical protein
MFTSVLDITTGTNATPHLYWMLCTGSIPGTNEGYEPVQMPLFPVVDAANSFSL